MKALRFLGIALLACGMLFVSCKKDKQFTITVNVNNPVMGTATGGGVYDKGVTATLTATPNAGYRFVKWSDGVQTNPYNVTVTENKTYTAHFEALPAGVYVTFGSDSWMAASFEADAETYASNNTMVIWLYKNSDSEYPQAQSCMQSTVGESSTVPNQRYVIYLENVNDTDAEGHPNWQPNNLTLNVTAIDLTTQKVTATVTGSLKNITTGETKNLQIEYRDAEWTRVTVQSKGSFKNL